VLRYAFILVVVGVLFFTESARAAWRFTTSNLAAGGHTVLVYPDGSLVGGIWQRWVDESREPTAPELVTMLPTAICGIGVVSCSEAAPEYDWLQRPIIAASSRYSLMFELGHLYDWHSLTSERRAYLARYWGASSARWQDSETGLQHDVEDGLQGVFAAVYASCATGPLPRHGYLSDGIAPPIRVRETCSLIRRWRETK